MFRNSGYSAHRLLISFSSLIVVIIIIAAFISYTSDIAREARINMLKMTEMQLKSTNRMLLSRTTILNLHLNETLDASLVDEANRDGVLTYGELIASKSNIPIFLSVNRLILKQGSKDELLFYPDEKLGKDCSLTYYQPFMERIGTVETKRHAARYILNVGGC